MVILSLKGAGTVGTISDDDFQMLVDQLEEESEEDTDYYVTPATIAMLAEQGASETLLGALRQAVGDSEGVDITWTRS